jgi:hypothetical protein
MDKSQLGKRLIDRTLDASARSTELTRKYILDGAEGKAQFADWLEAAQIKSNAARAVKATMQLNSSTVKKVIDEAR